MGQTKRFIHYKRKRTSLKAFKKMLHNVNDFVRHWSKGEHTNPLRHWIWWLIVILSLILRISKPKLCIHMFVYENQCFISLSLIHISYFRGWPSSCSAVKRHAARPPLTWGWLQVPPLLRKTLTQWRATMISRPCCPTLRNVKRRRGRSRMILM